MDMSDSISAALHTMKLINGATVIYRRGNQSVELVGVRGQSKQRGYNADGLEITWQSHEWTFHSDELELAGTVITPTRGDTIEETIDGQLRVYAVTHLNPAQQPYEWEDFRGLVTRIHNVLQSVT
ncbi:hypothetical protein Plim_2119 [Planctopirus limnophila DSM 3776]|uniref:Phage head-tail joining protein domain-containing protein n=2 Tax=Planctopirus limnophila TaxID=120 RepID=D5SMP1_PLAL2|nr:hypothetical protein Plim_2119 [Planctopirus limnophila DSM 3776]